MNYINFLERDSAATSAQIQALEDGIAELRAYIASEKFSGSDRLVNTTDVDTRLQDILRAGLAAHTAGQVAHVYAKETARALAAQAAAAQVAL